MHQTTVFLGCRLHYTGPSQGLKIRGGQQYWVGIMCPPWSRQGQLICQILGGLKPPQPPPCDGPAEYIYLKVKQNVIKIAAVTKIDLFDCNVSTVCFLMGINYIIHFLLSLQVSVLSCCTKVITIESTVWDLGFYFCFFKSGNVLFQKNICKKFSYEMYETNIDLLHTYNLVLCDILINIFMFYSVA